MVLGNPQQHGRRGKDFNNTNHSLIQQIFHEYLLCARHYSMICPCATCILVTEEGFVKSWPFIRERQPLLLSPLPASPAPRELPLTHPHLITQDFTLPTPELTSSPFYLDLSCLYMFITNSGKPSQMAFSSYSADLVLITS